MASVCSQHYAEIRPDQYVPGTFFEGTCSVDGEENVAVYRVRTEELDKYRARNETKGSETTYVELPPNWENTAKFFATGLAMHSFDSGKYAPVLSFVEQVVYLKATDPEGYNRFMQYLRDRANLA